jgi:predicted  nucleic acid-binding Zn-ribbon protein
MEERPLDWKAELAKLPGIQGCDRAIDHLRQQRRELAAGSATAEVAKRVANAEAQLARLRAERAAVVRQQRVDDLARQSEEAEKRRLTERLYSGAVRAPRDLEGLQKNIAGSEERIGALETRVLEAMEREESLTARIGEIERGLRADRERLAELQQAAARRLGELDAELADLQERRGALAAAVAAPVLREYERVRSRAGGVGVGIVTGGVCGACGVALPPLMTSRLSHGEGLLTCEHCGRILVEAT